MVLDFESMKKELEKEELKRKVKAAKDKAIEEAKKGVEWVKDHPVEAVGALAAVATVTTKVSRYLSVKAEDRRRLVDFYDKRLGTHAIAKRPLTTKEALEVERRYLNKESYKSILNSMGLLR